MIHRKTAIAGVFLSLLLTTAAFADHPEMETLLAEASTGDTKANFQIGKIHWFGLWVPQDRKKAIPYFQRAAIQGHSEASIYMHNAFLEGQGTEKNKRQAYAWRNHALELLRLNPRELREPFQADAALLKKRSPETLFLYGFLDQQGALSPFPPELREENTWEDWIRRSAKLGHPSAQWILGSALLLGETTAAEKKLARNVDAGEAWMIKAAEQGYLKGQATLGEVYFIGRYGLPKDYVKARRWLRIAAERGDSDSQDYYGRLILLGLVENESPESAILWLKRAAYQGNPYSQLRLGALYTEGKVTARNYIQAYAYLNAVINSSEVGKSAQSLLESIEREMKPSEIVKAQFLSQEIFRASQEQ